MSRCRSCDAAVVWVETEAREGKPGKRMPLDADPANTSRALKVDDGNLVMIGTTPDGTPIVRYVPKGPNHYRSHFATCVNAKAHRRG